MRASSLFVLVFLFGGLLVRAESAPRAGESAVPGAARQTPAQKATPAPATPTSPAAPAAAKPKAATTVKPSAATAAKPSATAAKPRVATAAKPSAASSDAVANAWKLLNDATMSKKYTNRSDAISALVVLSSDQRAVGMIEHGLSDSSIRIRVLAAVSLGEIGARSAIPALRAALDDRSPEVSFAAAQALWKMGDHSGRNFFYEILEGGRKTQPGIIQGQITKARQDLQDPKAMLLIGINAASGAMLGPGALGVSAIEELAINKSTPVQALCAKLLAEDDTPDTVTELKLALEDKNWLIRAAAARSLAAMKHPEVTPRMRTMMETDKKDAVRYAAAAAFIRLSAKGA